MEVLQNIWNHLTENQLTNSPFDVWMENILSDTDIQNNVYNYLSENGMTSSDFDTWSLNAGLKKKRSYAIRIGKWEFGFYFTK